MKQHIFSILCQNVPGVMMRITRAFTRKQVNLDSITVGIEPSGLARIILLFNADDRTANLMRKVLMRLEPIESVEEIDPENSVVREIALLKTVKLSGEDHWRVVERIEKAGGKIIEAKDGAIIAEISGTREEIDRLISQLSPDILKEVVRSGQVYCQRL
ncbi:MAG: acetolactate synthase small subunit [Candidatus Hadarchaeales archaeon]